MLYRSKATGKEVEAVLVGRDPLPLWAQGGGPVRGSYILRVDDQKLSMPGNVFRQLYQPKMDGGWLDRDTNERVWLESVHTDTMRIHYPDGRVCFCDIHDFNDQYVKAVNLESLSAVILARIDKHQLTPREVAMAWKIGLKAVLLLRGLHSEGDTKCDG